jgi:hypothetical protein
MNNILKKRWIAIGIIWGVVLGLFTWNYMSINHIRIKKEKELIFDNDKQFYTKNADNISKIMEQAQAIKKHTLSLNLALLYFENQINESAKKFDLTAVTIKSTIKDAVGMTEGDLPVLLSFKGSYSNAVKLMTDMQDKMPHIKFRNFKAALTKQINNDFEISLYFKYILGEIESPV